MRRLGRLRSRFNLISHSYNKLREVLTILKKPLEEKRNEKDLHKLEPLINQFKFFTKTKPMNEDERIELCKFVSYDFKESGETVYK